MPTDPADMNQPRDVVALTKNHGRVKLSEQDRARLWSRVLGDAESG